MLLRSLSVLLASIGVGAGALAAQPESPGNADADADAQSAGPARVGEEIPATVRLGLRLLNVWQQAPVAPTLVVVPDAETYLRALEHWRIGSMFPILIDDGSDEARQNIARFTRAYAPHTILTWSPEQEEAQGGAIRERVENLVARAWGADAPAALNERWKAIDFAPPGVVVMSEGDDAWVAGAALAAGHGQPTIWVPAPAGRPAQRMDAPALEGLDGAILSALHDQPWPWESLGDAIDGVTLCLNAPARIGPPPGADGDFALTDRIGRMPDGRRYAWCGIVLGDPAQAAYRAMCALFVAPDSGWIFDGYDRGYPPEYAAQRALEFFQRRGFPVTFTMPQGATIDVWRARCRTGIDAGLIHVNSAGQPTWFQLANKEHALVSEIPLLARPALVHFIHSFSAKLADHPGAISGRWLENGAYGYIGSVHEPTLGGFVAPDHFFARLFSGVPFGAAGRFDDAPAWKIQVIGDPLIIASPDRPRRDADPDLPGAVPMDDAMKTALEAHRFAEAITLLVEMGRDDDALRVARAAIVKGERDDRAAIARASIYTAFRAGDDELFVTLYEQLPPGVASDDAHQSMLWQLLRPLALLPDPDARVVSLLRHNIREESAVEDANDLRAGVSRLYGEDSVTAMFSELIERAKNDKQRQKLREAMGGG